ncbi:hypothetical protein TKK_0010258 [Trichogramma kaykai]
MECFLCTLLSKNNPKFKLKGKKLKIFKDEVILNNCKKFKKARDFDCFEYAGAVLPENTWDPSIGYHSSCYKLFRVKNESLLPEKFIENQSCSVNINEGDSDNSNSDSDEKLEQKCFFCNNQ